MVEWRWMQSIAKASWAQGHCITGKLQGRNGDWRGGGRLFALIGQNFTDVIS